MSKIHLKTGEFAALCGVTKDTLFHYDRIGLLRPVRIGANGYRYYSVYQADILDLIGMLKEVGLSLQEIRAYMENRNTDDFLNMLVQQDQVLAAEIKRLQRLRKLLKNTIAVTHQSFQADIGTISVEEQEETWFVVTPGPKKQDEKSMIEALGQHVAFCKAHGLYTSFTVGEIISEAEIAAMTYHTTWYCSPVDRPIQRKYLHVRPAGQYAVQYVQVPYEQLTQAYADFVCQLNQQGYALRGSIYEEDVINHLSESDDEQYIMKLAGRVEKSKDNKA